MKRFHANKGRPDWKQAVRYYIDLNDHTDDPCYLKTWGHYSIIIRFNDDTLSDCQDGEIWLEDDCCNWLEVSVTDLHYLKKPEGEWEFRKAERGIDTVMGVFTCKEGNAYHLASGVNFAGAAFLSGYRWCKPRNKHLGSSFADFTQEEFRAAHKAVMEMIDENNCRV